MIKSERENMRKGCAGYQRARTSMNKLEEVLRKFLKREIRRI